jgi:hypothetical protein
MLLEPALYPLLRDFFRIVAGALGLGADVEERLVILQPIPRAVHDVEVGAGRLDAGSLALEQHPLQLRIPAPHLLEENVVQVVGSLHELPERCFLARVQQSLVEGERDGRELVHPALEILGRQAGGDLHELRKRGMSRPSRAPALDLPRSLRWPVSGRKRTPPPPASSRSCVCSYGLSR